VRRFTYLDCGHASSPRSFEELLAELPWPRMASLSDLPEKSWSSQIGTRVYDTSDFKIQIISDRVARYGVEG